MTDDANPATLSRGISLFENRFQKPSHIYSQVGSR